MAASYNRRKRKFLLIWFFFLAISLATVTYAWFSSNRIVDLQFFDIHVETDGGLEISENAIDWKTELTVNDLKGAYKTYPKSLNQIPGVMRPTSSGGTIDNDGYLKIFYGQTDSSNGDYYLTAVRHVEERTTETSNNGDFIVFDVFFKTTIPKSLYLSGASFVTPKENTESVGIENSARIAFIKEGSTDIENGVNVAQSLKTTKESDIVIWEPNYDVHTEHGVSNAKKIYGIETSKTNAGILTYDGVIANINSSSKMKLSEANAVNYPNYFRKVNVGVHTKKSNEKNNYLFDIDAGITKVRLYMWLEGQDVDSENKASHGGITYFVEFTLNP